jgi:protein O-mannosyl-transferase
VKETARKIPVGPAAERRFAISPRLLVMACLSTFFGLLYLYSPALHGHFVFDDLALPFNNLGRDGPLSGWMSGVRPTLMFSYWLNYRFFGGDPFSYHFVNLVIHFVNTGLVFLVLCRLLTKAGWKESKVPVASALGALIFAIHPLQTESVSYIAGRSESLASLLMLLAYCVFLYRRKEAISWVEAVVVLVLFACAVKAKENAVSLAGVLLLTDVYWPVPFSLRGIRANWRLYSLMVPGIVVACVAVFRLLSTAQSAGFSVATFKWYQYAFTEARAIFTYIRLAVFPVGQSIDQDYPTSHNIMEHGAVFYIILLAALVVLAVLWRRRYPISCFGLLLFLTFLAPTSSIVPIDDALVERRMYLPLVGLILIACELGARVRVSRFSAACVLAILGLVFGKLCYDRNRLWGEPDRLLALAASGAVYNPRPMLNFTEILIQHNRCDLAPAYLERAERRLPNNYYVNAAWGRTLSCLGQLDQAMERLQRAAILHPCSQVYEWIGIVYGQMGRLEQAGIALKKAVELGPDSESAHGSLGLWYEKTNNLDAAKEEYRTAFSLNHADSWAKFAFIRVETMETGAEGPVTQR